MPPITTRHPGGREQGGTGGRLWRNLDKLMVDAQSSGKVNVRDFLDYLTTINDAGAREGEPAEAQGSVRLMTIHQARACSSRLSSWRMPAGSPEAEISLVSSCKSGI